MWEDRDKLESKVTALMIAGRYKKAQKISNSMIKNFSVLNNAGNVKSVLKQNINFEERLTRITYLAKGNTKSRSSLNKNELEQSTKSEEN